MHRFTGKELSDETGPERFATIDPLAEKYPNVSPYAYCNGNPVRYIDPDGRKLRVSKEFQQPFLTDMEKVFGNKTEQFRFDDSGIMSIEEGMKKFTDGLTSEQKKVFKGAKKVLTSRNTTSVVYADEYELTINNDKTSHDISTEFGGGVYSKNDDVIVVSPNVGVVEVTLDQFPFNSEIVEQNTTSTSI